MLERNSIVIDKNKSKEFRDLMTQTAKNPKFWQQNEEYLKNHKVNLDELEALFK